MKVLKVMLLVSVLALAASVVLASDIDFGSTARSIGMGGAGLALGDELATTAVVNPAAAAVSGKGFRFIFPSVGFHTTGASFSDLNDKVNDVSNGDTDSALDLVREFATQPTTLSVATNLGFAGPFGITVSGEAKGVISPSAEAGKWANAAQLFQDNPSINLSSIQAAINNTNLDNAIAQANLGNIGAADTAFDAYLGELSQNFVDASVAYGPTFSMSRGFNKGGGRLFLGANAQILHTESERWQITAARSGSLAAAGGVVNGGVTFTAVDLGKQESDSLKVDVGGIFRPANSKLQYGMVINNFIKPDIKGITAAQGDRMISVGVAAFPTKGIVLAADLINLNKANDENTQLRMGAECKLGSLFALRAGYAGSSWAYGVKVLGLNFAFSGRTAQLLSNVFKF